jgi:hypothetical protein
MSRQEPVWLSVVNRLETVLTGTKGPADGGSTPKGNAESRTSRTPGSGSSKSGGQRGHAPTARKHPSNVGASPSGDIGHLLFTPSASAGYPSHISDLTVSDSPSAASCKANLLASRFTLEEAPDQISPQAPDPSPNPELHSEDANPPTGCGVTMPAEGSTGDESSNLEAFGSPLLAGPEVEAAPSTPGSGQRQKGTTRSKDNAKEERGQRAQAGEQPSGVRSNGKQVSEGGTRGNRVVIPSYQNRVVFEHPARAEVRTIPGYDAFAGPHSSTP